MVREGAQVAPSGPPLGEKEQEPADPNLLPCPEPEADPRAKRDRTPATPYRVCVLLHVSASEREGVSM